MTDRLGPYPLAYDVPALEGRRYLWTARAFAVGMFASLGLNVALGFAVSALTPLTRVEPMLVTFRDKGEQIVRIEPFERSSRGFELMTEYLVREYALLRQEILLDDGEMARRWGGGGLVAHRSTAEEYQRFVAETAATYGALRQKRVTRHVAVHRVSKIAEGYWQVEFSTTDFDDKNAKILESLWVASMTIRFQPRRATWDDRYMNPLGFTVGAYSVVARS